MRKRRKKVLEREEAARRLFEDRSYTVMEAPRVTITLGPTAFSTIKVASSTAKPGSAKWRQDIRRSLRRSYAEWFGAYQRDVKAGLMQEPVLISSREELHRHFGRPGRSSVPLLLAEPTSEISRRLGELDETLAHAKQKMTDAFRMPPEMLAERKPRS